MGFTYKSSNVQAPDLYDPIDDNILLQGQKAIYDRTMAFAEEANKYKSAFFGQNAYGKDAEILKQKEAEYNAAISEVTKGGIESMEAQTAINAIINQASSDKDILGISQRTSAYERELKNKQEAEAKNENFISPLLDQANTYYGSGKYYSDERFNGSGWNDPNVEKMKTEALKNVKVEKKQTLVNGVWVETEQYDPDALKTALSSVYSTPLVQKTMAYKFDNKYKDFDFAGQGVAQTENSINLARQQSQEAFRVLQTGKKGTPQYQKALEDYTESEAYINKYSPLLQNPTERGEMLKAQLRQDEINNEIELAMTSAQFKSESAIKESQFALNNQKYAQDREMKLLETKAQLFEGMSDIDQKKFLVNPNDPTINYSVAYQTIQTNKNKNAQAVAEGFNPEIKLKKQVTSGGYSPTYEQATEGLGNRKNETIPETRLPYHLANILENEKYFRKLMTSYYTTAQVDKIINTLKANKEKYNSGYLSKDIKINDKTMYVDPDGSEAFSIPKDVLESVVNNQYNKIYLGTDLNNVEEAESQSTPNPANVISFKRPDGKIVDIPISEKALIDSAYARKYEKIN